jgi:fatty-acyl-CoA synthase
VPHPKWVEPPLILVVPREGCTVDPAGVLALYPGKVAKCWISDRVMVVDDLPHTATGKLNKLSLRARYGNAYAEVANWIESDTWNRLGTA